VKGFLIIFDMDGVLVDVEGSYREVVRRTVELYLRDVIGLHKPRDGFLSLADVDSVKKSGGLNNDWDLTYTILNCILKRYIDPYNIHNADCFTEIAVRGEERLMMEELRRVKSSLETRALVQHLGSMSVPQLCAQVAASTGPTPSPFLLKGGDVKSGNVVKRIFQELYLGAGLFREIYGEMPIFFKEEGLMNQEKLIPSPSQLTALSRSHMLSIATGRPAKEAEHAINHFGLGKLFRAVVTEDDVVAAEVESKTPLRKPHPFSIHLCIQRSGYTEEARVYYVGDMPDDMRASLAAGVEPIGFVYGGRKPEKSADEELLRENGASRVFFDFDALVRYFGGQSSAREM
jgi:HAD superfamily hydrolase (TIGR01548 family)